MVAVRVGRLRRKVNQQLTERNNIVHTHSSKIVQCPTLDAAALKIVSSHLLAQSSHAWAYLCSGSVSRSVRSSAVFGWRIAGYFSEVDDKAVSVPITDALGNVVDAKVGFQQFDCDSNTDFGEIFHKADAHFLFELD